MKAIKHTLKTLTDSLHILGRYRGSAVYPLLSYGILLLLTFTLIVPLLGRALGIAQEALPARLILFLIVYCMYIALYAVIAFFNVALVTHIAARLDGGAAQPAAGITRASERIGLIGIYSLVSATLGLLGFLARTLIGPLFGMIIAPRVGDKLWVRWHKLSYSAPLLMEIPVIALEPTAPRDAFKRGDQIIKQTWGEHVKPAHSIGLLALLVLLPIILLFAAPTLQRGAAAHSPGLIGLGLNIMLVAISTYTQLSALVNAIFALAAYRYAIVGKGDLFPGDASYAEYAFVKDKKAIGQPGAPSGTASDSSSVAASDSSS